MPPTGTLSSWVLTLCHVCPQQSDHLAPCFLSSRKWCSNMKIGRRPIINKSFLSTSPCAPMLQIMWHNCAQMTKLPFLADPWLCTAGQCSGPSWVHESANAGNQKPSAENSVTCPTQSMQANGPASCWPSSDPTSLSGLKKVSNCRNPDSLMFLIMPRKHGFIFDVTSHETTMSFGSSSTPVITSCAGQRHQSPCSSGLKCCELPRTVLQVSFIHAQERQSCVLGV